MSSSVGRLSFRWDPWRRELAYLLSCCSASLLVGRVINLPESESDWSEGRRENVFVVFTHDRVLDALADEDKSHNAAFLFLELIGRS